MKNWGQRLRTGCVVSGVLLLAGCGDGEPTVEEAAPPATSEAAPPEDPAPATDAPGDDAAVTTDAPGDDAAETTEPPTDAGPTTGGPPADAMPPTGAPTGSIRDTDFEGLTFTDTWLGQDVTLDQGTVTVEFEGHEARYTLEQDPVFHDVDGDGDEDALVRIFAEQGNGWSAYTYALLWDEATGAPHQVLPAITDDARCGNATTAIVPEDGTLTVHYLDRTVNSEACAEQPRAEASRTVKITDGYAFEIDPHLSALHHCGAIGAEPAPPEETGLPDGSIRAYPAEDAMALIDLDEALALSMPEQGMRTDPAHPGWTVIQFILPEQDSGAFEKQCGWLKTG